METGPRPLSHLPGRRFGPAVVIAFVIAVLSASLLALVLVPLALPSSCDRVSMTSESGAQGVRGAGVGRLAFVLLGLGVLLLAVQSSHRWDKLGTGLHSAFGIFMIAVTALSIRPGTRTCLTKGRRTCSIRWRQRPWVSPSPSG